MIIYRILILTIFSISCFFASSLQAQQARYPRTSQPVNTQSKYIDQRRLAADQQRMTSGKQAKIKNENKQLKDQLKSNQKEYKKLLKELEKAQKEADLCNSYVATPTYDNSSNTAQLQTSSPYDEFDYEDEYVDYGDTQTSYSGSQADYSSFEQYSGNSGDEAPKNKTLREQQLEQIKELEETLSERKATQAKQEAQLDELNKKIDAMLNK